MSILGASERSNQSLQPTAPIHVYEVRPRKDHRGADLVSDALPFGGLWYAGPNATENAIGYAMHRSRAADAVIRVYDAVGNVIETHEQKGEFNLRADCGHGHSRFLSTPKLGAIINFA